MTDLARWLDGRMVGAPQRLAERARAFVDAAGPGPVSERLALAGQQALVAAERRGRDRAAALDLLAADALITLALLAAAEAAPGRLAEEAARLRVRAAVAT
jgi:hypothetical protein